MKMKLEFTIHCSWSDVVSITRNVAMALALALTMVVSHPAAIELLAR